MVILTVLKQLVSARVRESYIDNAGGLLNEGELVEHYRQMALHLHRIVSSTTLSEMIKLIEDGLFEHCDVDIDWLDYILQRYPHRQNKVGE